MRLSILRLLWMLIAIQTLSADVPPTEPPRELERLIAAALSWHPGVGAARHDLAAAEARQRGLAGFFDTRAYAAAGLADEARSVPGATLGPATVDDAFTVEGGLERAFAPGFYGSVGMAERYHWNAFDGDRAYQTLFGAQVRVPLWRDRGFREYDLRDRQALADYRAACSNYLAAVQQLRRDVAVAYIALQEAHGVQRASVAASARVQALHEQAQELVRLEVLAEYQLNQARLEVSLREEEVQAANEAVETARDELARLTGMERTTFAELSTERFIAWAAATELATPPPNPIVYRRRGTWLAQENLRLAAEAGIEIAREQLKPDLSLRAGVAWQGEQEDRLFGDNTLLSEDHLGAAVQVVYTRPLSFTAEREQLLEREAIEARIREQQRDVENTIRARISTALIRLRSARERLTLTTGAVGAAQATLAAEADRFRLGEGHSRQVLDAERDLANTVRLQTRNAAALLRARADLDFETGYPELALQTQSELEGDHRE